MFMFTKKIDINQAYFRTTKENAIVTKIVKNVLSGKYCIGCNIIDELVCM